MEREMYIYIQATAESGYLLFVDFVKQPHTLPSLMLQGAKVCQNQTSFSGLENGEDASSWGGPRIMWQPDSRGDYCDLFTYSH